MNLQEIVAAVIDSVTLTTDLARINASRALGQDVRLITRRDATQRAIDEPSRRWTQLAIAPTLMLSDGVALFRSLV